MFIILEWYDNIKFTDLGPVVNGNEDVILFETEAAAMNHVDFNCSSLAYHKIVKVREVAE